MTSRLITAQELIQAPTGVDWGTIGESGIAAAIQAVEQANVIDRASSWIANYCTQRLDCTTDNEESILGGSYTKCWTDKNGYLWYRTDFFPILSISSMSWGQAGAGSAPTAFNQLNVANLLTFGEFNRINRVADFSQNWSGLKWAPGLIKITYVNGYPNMVSTAAFAAGNNINIAVDSSLGCTITPGAIGNVLTIYDGALTETASVVAVPDATHITLDTVDNAHATPGVGISAIPGDVKEAAILACVHFARERGVEAFVMGGAPSVAGNSKSEALAEAEYMLQPYKRIL